MLLLMVGVEGLSTDNFGTLCRENGYRSHMYGML